MNTLNKYLSILLFLTTFVGVSQEEVNEDTFTYEKVKIISSEKETIELKGAPNNAPNKSLVSSNLAPSSETTGETLGALSVSLTGGAQYTIPIAVPPGINGIIPEISLSYNSQGGNGIAGYGWNINGISTISRIPATEFHDNLIDGVNLDNLDRFALDGQRLILKSGTYGANGAEYQTEQYSNLKIKSFGTHPTNGVYGPAYFIVYYPDGSLAQYGNGGESKSLTNYSITYWQNPQGVRISYEYQIFTTRSKAQRIHKIKYGSLNTTNPINEISFGYQVRDRWQESYVNGEKIQRKNILKSITTYSNSDKYRTYRLTHDKTSLEYNRLTRVDEYSGDFSSSHHPIQFSYRNSNSSVTASSIETDITIGNIEQRNAETVALDFTGNGKMDFVAYPKNKSKFWMFSDIQEGTTNAPLVVNSGTFEAIFPSKYLNSSNKIIQNDALTIIKNTSNNKVNFETYSSKPSQPIFREHTKVWNAPTYEYQYDLDNSQTRRIPQEYISGDFNGDGLTDVLAIGKSYTKRTCRALPPSECDITDPQELTQEENESDDDFKLRQQYLKNNKSIPCMTCSTVTINNKATYLIELKRNAGANFANYSGQLLQSISANDKIQTGDFNGDGVIDFLHIINGRVYVYTLVNNRISLLWLKDDTFFTLNKPYYLGDYNGDGKTDFIIPTANNSNRFRVYASTGNAFTRGNGVFPFSYKQTSFNGNNGVLSGFSLIPADFNGDGKTDFIEYNTTTYENLNRGFQDITIYNNTGIYSAPASEISYATSVKFVSGGSARKTSFLDHFPIPIFLTNNKPNKNLDFASISDNQITSFSFNKDHKEEMLLRSVENQGVTYSILYNSLDPEYTGSYPETYKYTNSETYPYGNTRIAPSTKVVTKLFRRSNGMSAPILTQEYSYYDAVYHSEGLGFLGFRGVAQSNWHTNSSDRIFNVALYDHSKRGALMAQYSTRNSYTFTIPTSGYINKTIYENTFSLSNNKVYKLSKRSSLTQNAINGTFTNVTYAYDNYNNLTQAATNYSSQAMRNITIQYANSTDTNYYIGRPIKEIERVTINGDTFETKKELEYSGYLVSKIKHFGNDTPADIETLNYDNFGNTITKTVTPHNSQPRIVQFQYDTSGRFLKKTINVEGQQTLFDYNYNEGTLTKRTNAYGQASRYEYDSWLRPIKVIDHLGKQLETTYTDNLSFKKTVTTTADDGSESNVIYDSFGRVEEVKEKDVTGQWVGSRYEYDKFDRVKRQSEPFVDGASPTQWNETQYDFYGRPIKQILYTGRTINITYSDLSVTVNDGVKTVTTTSDAIGNTKSVNDPGGTINYNYHGSGNLKTANYNGVIVSLEEDNWGRKKKLTDPSAGVYEYDYNGYGEMIKEKTPKGETEYFYSPIGKLEKKTILGDDTDMEVLYNYNSTNKLLNRITMTSSDGNNSTYDYAYDNLYRIKETKERNPYAEFSKNITYDAFGRVNTEQSTAKLLSNNTRSSKKIIHSYQNGSLKSITDRNTGEILSSIDQVNARGQATKISMGNGLVEENAYTPLGYLQESKVINNGGFIPVEMMKLTTNFNAQRGTLNSRTNSLFSWSETFGYDDLDRLITFNDNDGNNNHTYDNSGRITSNNTVGDYNYSGTAYQVDDIELNTQGDLYYQNNSLEQVSYNAFKKPVKIKEEGKDVVHFKYNAFMGRAHKFHGSTEEDIAEHTKSKHYSSDGSMEISFDKESNKTTFVTYMGGDAYSAPAIWRSEQQDNGNTIEDYYYLYRDYLGSIIMISDKNGEIKEKRHFDAWGNIIKVADGNDNELEQLTFLDRGYTGHEHLQGVNLIHMNGRLYDPKLKRFLAPDNFIQNISNTQNFNRYGYVLNNPLMYSDPSGNIIEPVSMSFAVSAGIYFAFQGVKALAENANWKVAKWFDTNFESAKKDVGDFFDKLFGGKKKDKQSPLVNYENTEVLTQDPIAGGSASTSNEVYAGGGTDTGGLGVNNGPRHMLSQSTGNNHGPWYHRWGNSDNILANISYSIVNDAFQVVQSLDANLIPSGGINPLTGYRANRNIDGTPNYSPAEGVVNTAATLLPLGKAVQGVKALFVSSKVVAKGGQTIIGEGMKRVSAAAANSPGSTILNNMPNFTGSAEQITSQMMQYNRKWLLQRMRSGGPIIDIGLDPSRGAPSIFYQMEQNMLKNYLKIHPNAFKVKKL